MKYLNSQSFSGKLKTAFLAVIILSVLITGVFSYSISANIMEKNALKLTEDTVIKSAQIVDEKLNKLMLIMMTFMISQPFHNMLKDVSTGDDSRYYTRLADLDNVFSQARIAEPLIHSIYISTPIGEFYPLSMNRNRESSFHESPLYERIASEQKNVWVEGHEDMLFSGKDRVISLILEPIFDTPVHDVYIVVNIREEGFRKLVSTEAGKGSSQFLLNSEGVSVYGGDTTLISQVVGSNGLKFNPKGDKTAGSTTYHTDHQTYLINYASLGITDWTMITIQSKAYVLKDMIYLKWMILSITVGAFIVTVTVSGAFTRYLLRPLQELRKVMKRVEANDLSARFEGQSEDELAQVGYRFNRMLEQIVVLIEEVKEAEMNKRSTEIKALSAQMDPHFLYNTLNTVYWKLKLGQVEESQKMVVSLSRLFQLGLNKGNEITTLNKEVEHMRQYLEIQTLCYDDLFQYDIQVKEPWLMDQPVPRIMLQPLVENSILHGFKDMESGGFISVNIVGDPAKGKWTIRVWDNGRGMNGLAVHSQQGDESEQEHGFALRNLNSRIQLYYGHQAELKLESELGKGTAVMLSLPLKGEDYNV